MAELREVVLDVETTGLNPTAGDRVIEIGCLELINHVPTGKVLQHYVQPDRDIPDEVVRVHGITAEKLADKPRFAEIADEVTAFLGDGVVVAHNAQFDLGFLNEELARAGRAWSPAKVVDTVALARRKFPGAPASLDALCEQFRIDASARTKHGALLDAQLLADVYIELIGGRQPGLSLGVKAAVTARPGVSAAPIRPRRQHAATAEELAAHAAFVDRLENPIWRQ